MTRKCRLKTCRKELPPIKGCETLYQKAGFCDVQCVGQHGADKRRRQIERQKEKQRKEEKALTRKQKEALLTRSDWVSKAQKVVNKLVVLEDGPKGCISCGSSDVTDAGHFFHRGSKYRTSPLTLDRRNLSGQCPACNRFKGGGAQYEYMLGYIERYGKAAFQDLEEFKRSVDHGEVAELTIDDCQRIIEETKAKIKAMRGQRAA